MKSTILLVEDESSIREMIAYTLSKSGFDVLQAETPTEAFSQIADHNPQLILMDWMLPDQSGIEIIRRLRRENYTKNIPIIMLTAKSEENDKVWGLEAGADDYITKPVKPKILIKKISSISKRMKNNLSNVLDIGELKIDKESYLISINKEDISLPRKEFELLYLMATKPGKVFSRDEIMATVWGTQVIVGDRTIDVHIRKLREKIGEKHIKTLKGVGYKFKS